MDYFEKRNLHNKAMKQSNGQLPNPTHLSRGEISTFAGQWFKQTQQKEAREFRELAKRLGVELNFQVGEIQETSWKVSPYGIDMFSLSHFGFETDRLNIMMGFAMQQLYPAQAFEIRQFDFSEQAKKIKQEAQWFSWGALLPREQFEAKAVQLRGSVRDLAWHFHVKQSDIQSRAKSFDLDLSTFQASSPRMRP